MTYKFTEEHRRRISEARKKIRGYKHRPETIEKMRLVKLGERNPIWKGDNVSYRSLHEWIGNHLPKPEYCQICNKDKPYDAANISGRYLRDLNDWQYLCRACHMESDGRLERLHRRFIKC
jgi:hypothetical protein